MLPSRDTSALGGRALVSASPQPARMSPNRRRRWLSGRGLARCAERRVMDFELVADSIREGVDDDRTHQHQRDAHNGCGIQGLVK